MNVKKLCRDFLRNMLIYPHDFVELMAHIKEYLSCDLKEIKTDESYPVAV